MLFTMQVCYSGCYYLRSRNNNGDITQACKCKTDKYVDLGKRITTKKKKYVVFLFVFAQC
jgi:hypothetical protein